VSNDYCKLYMVDYEDILRNIRITNAHRILLQAPNGLKKLCRCITEYLTSRVKDLEIYCSASPSYGSCDLPVEEVYVLKPDILIHIGHNKYPLTTYDLGVKTIYVPAYYKWKPSSILVEKLAGILRENSYKNIGLVASIQHVYSLDELGKLLMDKGFNIFIGKPKYEDMVRGQILGCEYSAALSIEEYIDAYIVVAGGYFHGLGLSLISSKPVLILDPYREEVVDYTRHGRRVLAYRYYLVSRIRNTPIHSVGVIIGTRPGQYRPYLVKLIVDILRSENIAYHLFSTIHIDKERLMAIDNSYNLDLYVITSCPRLPIDDLSDFPKPVITPGEFLMIFRNIEKYVYPW
jgi:2-(3-amino-3-carboxypropyl)histidine synthase